MIFIKSITKVLLLKHKLLEPILAILSKYNQFLEVYLLIQLDCSQSQLSDNVFLQTSLSL